MSRNSLFISTVFILVLAVSVCVADRIRVENDMQGPFDRNRDGFLTEEEIPAFKEFMQIREKITHLNRKAEEGQNEVNRVRAEAEKLENRLRRELEQMNKPDKPHKMEEAERKTQEMFEKAAHLEREGMERQAWEVRAQAEKMAQELHNHHMEMQEKELAKMKEHIVHLRELSEQAEKKGKIDEAKQLWRESEEIEAALKREFANRKSQNKIEQMHREIKELLGAAERAERAGNGDKADNLRREAEELEMRIDEIARNKQLEEMENEIRNLRELAENEESKGHHDKAHAIAGEAEQLKRHLLEIIKDREHEDHGEDEEINMKKELEGLRHEVNKLREIVEDLREKLSDRR